MRWVPPARFALWWRLTEACSKRTGDFAAVQWYIVPNADTLEFAGERLHGYWIGEPNRIVLAGQHRLAGPLVRHEMLHALLPPGAGHTRDSFLTACDGVVACDGACAIESGGRDVPPASAPELYPRDLAIRVELVPHAPTMTADSGAVAVIVEITNPSAEPSWARLTPQAPGDPYSHTFGILIDYDDPARLNTSSYVWITGARFPLGASETRRYVWDGDLPAGRFGIRGFFNADTANRFIVEVGR